jgi:hypothetical protein
VCTAATQNSDFVSLIAPKISGIHCHNKLTEMILLLRSIIVYKLD